MSSYAAKKSAKSKGNKKNTSTRAEESFIIPIKGGRFYCPLYPTCKRNYSNKQNAKRHYEHDVHAPAQPVGPTQQEDEAAGQAQTEEATGPAQTEDDALGEAPSGEGEKGSHEEDDEE